VHKSCDGLSTTLTASEVEARAIAGNMDVDERMDVMYDWEKEKGEIERFEEDLETSVSGFDAGYSEKEKNDNSAVRNYMKKNILEFPYFGEADKEEWRTICKRIEKDMEEIRTGDMVEFTTDVFEQATRKANDCEVSMEEKRMKVTAGGNIIRYAMSGLEDQVNMEIDRRKIYKRMKGLYILYRKKYETLSKRNTEGKEVQVDMGKEMDVDVDKDRRKEHREEEGENSLEKKINYLIEKVNEMEKRISGKVRNVSQERKEEETWTKVLGGRRDKKKGKSQDKEKK